MAAVQTYFQAFTGIFGADKVALADVYKLQNDAPNLLMYTLPAVFLFTLLEGIVSHYSEHKSYERKETLGSLMVGAGNLMVNLFMKTILISGAIWIYNLLPWRITMNWYTLPVCFIAYDFCSYWSHRISHYNRFFWATHVVHHSADHYNLTVAFRQSWVQHFKTIFFIPVALMGFHPVIFFVASQLSTLYQFWVHTESIGKLHPFIEKYFGTPSNHRVHHGSQEKYLDKNFGATFMIWDHLFGSFQYEEEKPIYGLTTPLANKTNPFILNFHEYKDMYTDLKQSRGIKEGLFFIFASPAKIYRYKLAAAASNIIRLRRPNTRLRKAILKVAMITIFLLLSQLLFAQQEQSALPTPKGKDLLFFLQRTPDANTVIYEINYKNDGSIDQHSPVKGSWVRYEEKEKYKDLTNIEKQFAYGVKCKALGNGAYEIRLAAYQKIPMYLMKVEGDQKYRIYIKDEGKNLLLKRIFVKVNGGSFWFPKVQYIDLFTINSETGIEILKRINLG
jgi:sterol desaturase/sphingolipid hydroxylase (fatty acid hydroxylase superfamily)